jgi:hypothetical protein
VREAAAGFRSGAGPRLQQLATIDSLGMEAACLIAFAGVVLGLSFTAPVALSGGPPL